MATKAEKAAAKLAATQVDHDDAIKAPTTPRSRNNLMVGCKLPNGAHLRLHKEETFRIPVGNQMETEKRFIVDQEAPIFTLPGIARGTNGEGSKAIIIDGATITAIDSDFMRAWLAQNKKHPWVTSGMVFVADTRDEAESEAKGRMKVRSNQEPMNPAGDPRARVDRHRIEPATPGP